MKYTAVINMTLDNSQDSIFGLKGNSIYGYKRDTDKEISMYGLKWATERQTGTTSTQTTGHARLVVGVIGRPVTIFTLH